MIKYNYITIPSKIIYNDIIINDIYFKIFPMRGPFS